MAKGKCCRKTGCVAKSPSGGNRRKNKKFYSIFFCEGHPPPVCLRCSPGLLRHACGVASCHTSSMPAKPHLGLTQNSSPTTFANGRRAAQNRGVQKQRLWSPAAGGTISGKAEGRRPHPVSGWWTAALYRTVSDNVPAPQTMRGSPSLFVGPDLCVPPPVRTADHP